MFAVIDNLSMAEKILNSILMIGTEIYYSCAMGNVFPFKVVVFLLG